MAEIILKLGREKPVIRRHPWIFSGAVMSVNGSPNLGEVVDVLSSGGDFLARAAYNPKSNIMGRIWSWDENEGINPEFFHHRLAKSFEYRRALKDLIHSDAQRLVHGESDGLPGLIVDQYKGILVVQFLTAGIECWRNEIIQQLIKMTEAETIYERSDQDVRELEGLPQQKGLLYGQIPGNPPVIEENGLQYFVDFINGHKTGLYLDQRENRCLAQFISKGKDVLDCFSYNGGFGINALHGEAKHVTVVDSSGPALNITRENIERNKLGLDRVNFIEQDVFKYLRTLRDMGESYDLVILDPPKFAPTSAQVERATRGYKDINVLALKLLRPGGWLMTFSCSGGVSEELFQKIITGAAFDAGVDAVIARRLHQAVDHPVALNFPEGAYLKGFLVQKRS